MGDRSCRNCKYGYRDSLEDLVCTNDESEYVTDYVYEDTECEYWEDKECE